MVSPARILGVSHTHPGGTYSWICAKVKKTTTSKATLRVSGAGATYPGQSYRKTLRWKGTKIISFKIVSAGPYTVTLRLGTRSSTRHYTVPPPTGPANGPFPCV
jgi:hypothetical protein